MGESSSYFQLHSITISARNDIISTETIKFKHSTSSTFTNKRQKVATGPRRRTYFTIITMNNVMNLTDDTGDSQLSLFSSAQQQQLHKALLYDDNITKFYEGNIESEDQHDNLWRALSKVSSLINKSNEDTDIVLIYRHILEKHLLSEVFNDSIESEFSEANYIAYLWGPVIMTLFLNTDLIDPKKEEKKNVENTTKIHQLRYGCNLGHGESHSIYLPYFIIFMRALQFSPLRIYH
ncbi:hypothetical protein EDC94DRAFT_586869 [Helicostylum pulchrum]|nr:hypothetical protein EDC94DRAFT_586869 [Helicostylum pulchrum]